MADINGNRKNNRNYFYTLLSVGKKQLGMDEDTYRGFLMNHGANMIEGKISATTMSIGQLSMAVETMKNRGFKPTRKSNVSKITDERKGQIKKITAMWINLFDAGVVRDRSEKAMLTWCAAVTKKAHLQWASSQDLNRCIEGLKSWGKREKVTLR